MNVLFADASYFLAVLIPNDQWHQRAAEFSATNRQPMLTTEWILTEVADALARGQNRALFLRLLKRLQSDLDTTIIKADHTTWTRGLDLYERRPDKNWSLTDCISFVVMQSHSLTDAITADRDFEQAGFKILLR